MFVRGSLKVVCLLIAATLLSSYSSLAQAQDSLSTRKKGVDWPQFLGPTHNSVSTEKGILTDWGNKPLKMLWSKGLGEGYGIGVTAKGRYYQFDRFRDTARLYCLNAETGEELWRHEYATQYVDLYGYSGGPRCSPLVDGDYVYALGVEGRLLCCHRITGKLIWEVDTNKQYGVIQNFFGVGSNPIIHGDLLICMIGGSPADDKFVAPGQLDRVTPNGSGIVAFDKKTGKEVYRGVKQLASYASLTQAKINDQHWCFAFCRDALIGFDPKTGKVSWEYPWRARILESVNASTPIIIDDQVLISETYGPGTSLLKVASGKASVVWADNPRKREKAMQTHWNTPIHHDGYVYGSSGRHRTAELRCIRLADGKVMWSEPDLTRASLLKVDGHFVCLGEDGVVRLLKINPKKYEEIGVLRPKSDTGSPLLREPCWAAPVLSHGLLYLRGDRFLICYELIPE